jgi:hypothetical protein
VTSNLPRSRRRGQVGMPECQLEPSSGEFQLTWTIRKCSESCAASSFCSSTSIALFCSFAAVDCSFKLRFMMF